MAQSPEQSHTSVTHMRKAVSYSEVPLTFASKQSLTVSPATYQTTVVQTTSTVKKGPQQAADSSSTKNFNTPATQPTTGVKQNKVAQQAATITKIREFNMKDV